MATIRLVVDGARMAALLRSPAGPVGRYMIERGTAFQAAARHQQPRKTGCLQDSTVKRVEDIGGEIAIRVLADTTPCSPTRTSYSLYVHEGTKPHDIPNAFGWGESFGVGGRFAGKFHPGNGPNRFFTDNLHLFVHA